MRNLYELCMSCIKDRGNNPLFVVTGCNETGICFRDIQKELYAVQTR